MPLNRLVAFVVKPVVSVAVGTIAAWITVHVPGVNINDTAVTEAIVTAVSFFIATHVTGRGFDKWLEGWQMFEERTAAGTVGDALPGDDPNVPAGLR